MHHLIFIPCKPDLNSSLIEVGLANHVDGASLTPIDSGPGGRSGCLVSWQGVKPAYEPEQQEWIPAVPRDGFEKERYWVGINPSKPPEPRHLLRSRPLHGSALRFADGEHWTLPPVKQLPTSLVLNNEGEFVPHVKVEYQAYVMEVLRQVAKIEDSLTGVFEIRELTNLVHVGLSFNYRLPLELAARMGMFGTDEVVDAFCAVAGLNRK